MKKLFYQIKAYTGEYNPNTSEVEQKLTLVTVTKENPTEAEIANAEKMAYNGEYEIFDDNIEEIQEPTQLDRIEAQVTYTAMMTDTLLED